MVQRSLSLSQSSAVTNDVSTVAELAKNLHRVMVRIRYFEEKVGDLVREGTIITPCHLYIGQEAVAAGSCASLRTSDTIWGTHRSHGHYLAKGGDLKAAMAEIFCRQTGCSGGRGGSMHLCAPDIGLAGTSAIVAGSVPLGVGAALAEFVRGGDGVSLIFHGDAAPEEGSYHEVANFAALHRLPVVFVCENNQYCTHLHMSSRRQKDNLAEIFSTYGIHTIVIDGNDVMEVYNAVSHAVDEAREGKGPWFVECKTYRWRGHVGPNWDVDKGLRSQDEVDEWVARCPIASCERFMLSKGLADEAWLDRVHHEARTEVDQAVEYAQASPYPAVCNLDKFVYCREETN